MSSCIFLNVNECMNGEYCRYDHDFHDILDVMNLTNDMMLGVLIYVLD